MATDVAEKWSPPDSSSSRSPEYFGDVIRSDYAKYGNSPATSVFSRSSGILFFRTRGFGTPLALLLAQGALCGA
jgi:hypothetical protein